MGRRAALVALVLATLPARAEDAPAIKLDLRDTDAAKVVETLSRLTGLSVELAPELRARKATLRAEGKDWPEQLARALDAKVFRDKDELRIVPAWQIPLLEALRSKVTFAFQGRGLKEVLSVLATYTGASTAWDPKLPDPRITLQAASLTAAEVLDLVLEPNGAAWDLRWGVVYIAPRERIAVLKRAPDPSKGLPDETFVLSVQDETPRKVLEIAARRLERRLVVHPDAEPALRRKDATLFVKKLPVRDLLTVLLVPRGLVARLQDDALEIVPAR